MQLVRSYRELAVGLYKNGEYIDSFPFGHPSYIKNNDWAIRIALDSPYKDLLDLQQKVNALLKTVHEVYYQIKSHYKE